MKTSIQNPPAIITVANARPGIACEAWPIAWSKFSTLSSALNGKNSPTSRQRTVNVTRIAGIGRFLRKAETRPFIRLRDRRSRPLSYGGASNWFASRDHNDVLSSSGREP